MYSWKERNIRKIKKYGKKGPVQRKIAKILIYSIVFFSELGKWVFGYSKKMISFVLIVNT